MIKSVSVTPVYSEWENPGHKKATRFGIFIDCDTKEADEILNLINKMIGLRQPTESEERENDD